MSATARMSGRAQGTFSPTSTIHGLDLEQNVLLLQASTPESTMLTALLAFTNIAEAGCHISTSTTYCNESEGTCSIELYSDDAWSLCAVDYVVLGGTATYPSDYTITSGTAIWVSDGEYISTIEIPLVDDTTPEKWEKFSIELNPIHNATVSNFDHQVEVSDDDLQLIPSWAELCTNSLGTYIPCTMLEWYNEGNDESGTAYLLRMSLTAVMAEDIGFEVFGAESFCDASSFSDFKDNTITGIIPAGDTEVIVEIPLRDDPFPESVECFTIFSDSEDAFIPPHSLEGFIVDND